MRALITFAAADVLVVGAPTHMHGLPTSLSRRMAAKASEEEGIPQDLSATADPEIRSQITSTFEEAAR